MVGRVPICLKAAAVLAALSLGLAVHAQSPLSAAAVLPGMNMAETRADAVWQMRAGLNVAALQCQFSPFLMTVPTYNALLRQHSDEMGAAFKQMTSYFIKQKGPRVGQRAFDTYATRTNQSWATFDAQLSFCEAAALVGRRALAVPKGQFGAFALAEMAGMRESLLGHTRSPLMIPRYEYAAMHALDDPCAGRSARRCK